MARPGHAYTSVAMGLLLRLQIWQTVVVATTLWSRDKASDLARHALLSNHTYSSADESVNSSAFYRFV